MISVLATLCHEAVSMDLMSLSSKLVRCLLPAIDRKKFYCWRHPLGLCLEKWPEVLYLKH